jgi:hypothetical protein
MGLGVKNLDKRNLEFTRKLIISSVVILCLLFGVGVSLVLSYMEAESATDQILKVLGYVALPIWSVTYIITRYYKGLLRKSNITSI